jgi:hypothetical protein
LKPSKVTVTPEQIQSLGLSPRPGSKSDGPIPPQYEFEAIEPDRLVDLLQDAIRGALDMDRFADEQRQEAEDRQRLATLQAQIDDLLKNWPVD